MTIIEAIEAALEEHKCITRARGKFKSYTCKLKPTKHLAIIYINTSERTEDAKNNSRILFWNPTAEDILSNEWELCD